MELTGKKMGTFICISLFLFFSLYSGLLSQEEEQKKQIDKYFQMSVEELLEAEIYTAGKTDEKISEIPASVVLVTREDIERYGYRSLAEILENVPGLYNIDNKAHFGTVFGVRGYWTGWPGNFIIMVNGIEQADSWNLHILQNIKLPVEAIDRIEVVRGPMSVMYGSGAFFGAINIITNRIPEGETASLVSGSLGSEKTRQAALRFAHRDPKTTLVLNVGYCYSYGPDEPLSKMVSDMSFLDQFGISAENQNTTTGGRLEHNNIYFNLFGAYKGFFTQISFNRSAREEYHFWPSVSDGLLHKRNFTTLSFGYAGELSETISIKGVFKYYYSSYWREFDYFVEDFYGQETNHSTKYEIELNAIFKPSVDFDLLAGFNFKEKDATDKLDLRTIYPLSTGHYNDNIRTAAFFAQANYSPFLWMKFVAGIRLEAPLKYSLNHLNNETGFTLKEEYAARKIELVPRLAMILALNEKNIIKFLFGKAVKFPSYLEVLQQKISDYDDLEAEYITTFEINYIAALSPKLSLNLSIFHNNLDNLVVTMLEFDDEGSWGPRRSNSGKMVTNGVEFMLYAKPLKNLLLELSGTYQETKDKRPGFADIDVAYSPNLLGYVKASYRFAPNATLSLTGKYVDSMETLWDVAKINPNGSLGDRIAHSVDGYFTLDANIRINNLFAKTGYLDIKCANIFDKDYLYPLYTSNSGWADKGTFGHGRRFLVTLGWKF